MTVAKCKKCGRDGLEWLQNKAGRYYLADRFYGARGSSWTMPHFKQCRPPEPEPEPRQVVLTITPATGGDPVVVSAHGDGFEAVHALWVFAEDRGLKIGDRWELFGPDGAIAYEVTIK
ncbi:hypothetical protein SEA_OMNICRITICAL_89 [Mycobacterium phage OmniCritical]|uniref:hypothetical protein n=1 Tax=Mycobacterium phage Cheetobro TaxID=1506716 RepID=UPI0004E5D5E7|nr:hypothetical protein PBI_CHEETOBRO_87 [Mycobacterium phage Cheetobro]AII27257.1 hypothetical protein PBI_CHEETOBRO_87 [Mycobacterium phage Cheetobro]ALA46358.1 hypothetical protein PBI_SLARP_87 [Mycobacterium phage Slarp]UUG69780.1 hypothetical protein SEA_OMNICRITICAL_89 [Mycobacterium phage OmniCritical]